MKDQVDAVQADTLPALSEASTLLKKRQEVVTRQHVLSTFNDRFVMTEDQVAALTSTAEPVDDVFFESLAKSQCIIKDCEILLGLEKQVLGLDLMDHVSKYLNLGFQKLYKWVQREFKTLNLENPQMNTAIRRALRVLAERPSLFQNCLDFFAEARDRILSESFQVALTGASSSGNEDPSVKPIDLAAHDPLRYVGDMLAWIHSAAVSEREALEVLFVAEGEELAKGLKTGRDAEMWRVIADEEDEGNDFNALKALGDLVDRDMAGAARVLRQRIEQVVQSNEETIPAYKLAMLTNFYLITFEKLLGPASNLSDCVRMLEAEAMRQFRALLRDNITAVQRDPQHIPSDLEPPVFFVDALNQLEVIMETYDSTLSVSQYREREFEEVMADAFEPFLAGCESLADSVGPLDRSIFIVNFHIAAAKCLVKFDFTRKRADELQHSIDTEAARIVANQHEFLCSGSGLHALLALGGETLDNDLRRQDLSQASQQLDEFLPSALMDAMDRIKLLQDSKLSRKITDEAAEMFCRDFEQLEEAISSIDLRAGNDQNQESLRSVFPRTSTEIRVLLS